MKSLRIRFILGLIAAAVSATEEQVLQLQGVNKVDNRSFDTLMERPHRGLPLALVATTGALPYGLLPPADSSRMYVALGNAVAAFDTDERYEVIGVPASQTPRAIIYPPGAVGRKENREPPEPVAAGGSSHCGERRLEEWDARSRVSWSDEFFGRVSCLTPETSPTGRSLVIDELVSGIESLSETRF